MVLDAEGLKELPTGSAVLTSGGIVYVKYEADRWGRCRRYEVKWDDSASLAEHTAPVLIFRYSETAYRDLLGGTGR